MVGDGMDRDAKLSRLFNKDAKLRACLTEPVQAFVLPVAHLPAEAMVVWLYLPAERLCWTLLLEGLRLALQGIAKRKLLAGLRGVDIVPSLRTADGQTDRIVRVSVWPEALHVAMGLSAEQLRSEQPAQDVYCTWYWQPDDPRLRDVGLASGYRP